MRRGGNIGMFLQSIQHQDPHSTYNQDRLTASDSQYAALREEIKSAMSSGNQAPVTALTTKLHEMESAAFEARQEAQRQHIIDLGTGIFYFVGGVGIALGSNLSLGAIPHGRFDHPAFLHGQMTGDRLSVVCGVVEFALGKGITGGGELVMVASGGVLAPVAVPISAGGAALVSHGSLVIGQSLLAFSRYKEGQVQGRYVKAPPGNLNKLKNNQGWRDKKQNIWKKDMKHKDHWDVIDPKTGKKIKEVDFDGNQIWPGGPKNKAKQ